MDFGSGTLQPLGGFPGGFGAGEGDRVTRVGRDPVAQFGFVLRAGIAVKPGQQARGLRLDRVPAAAA